VAGRFGLDTVDVGTAAVNASRSPAAGLRSFRMTSEERTRLVCELASAAGFERAGTAEAGPVRRADYLRQWLERGFAGEMEYLGRWRELRCDPCLVLPGARSVLVVAHVYGHTEGERASGGAREMERRRDGEIERGVGRGTATHRGRGTEGQRDGGAVLQSEIQNPKSEIGRVAQYAWGRDYHKVMRKKLHGLVDAMRRAVVEPFEARVCVDTAPVLEREWAAAAGVGWIGKNTLVLHRELGSFFFLGEVLTTLELAPSSPAVDHCGTCTRCLQACPTGALIAPYRMDARRCISYLTIEHRSEIPGELRPLMGDWLYGCDVCQDVCPYNRRAPATREPAYEAGGNPLAPVAHVDAVANMTAEEYQQALAGSAMKRASLEMLKRNAGIVRNAVSSDTRESAGPREDDDE
jgi:epoxyqueuosine reductase